MTVYESIFHRFSSDGHSTESLGVYDTYEGAWFKGLEKLAEIEDNDDCDFTVKTIDVMDYDRKNRIGLKPEEKKDDPVNHPSHYTQGKIECIDFIVDKKLNFCRGNAVKYIVRAGLKDPSKEIEDLEKAVFYINKEIQTLKERIKDEIATIQPIKG